jgi:capsular polysaccharide biosynthesis protein
MELRDLARILSQRRVPVLLVTAAVTVAAIAFGFSSGATYTASTEVLAPQTTVSTVLGEQRPAKGVEWQAGVARSAGTMERAAASLDGVSAADLAGATTVRAADTTSEYVMIVSATSASPETAAAYANAVADAYVAITAENLAADVAEYAGDDSPLGATLAGLPELDSARARVLRAASAPAAQSPLDRAARTGALGLTLGLALGIAVAFIIDQVDDTVSEGSAVLKRTGAPVAVGLAEGGPGAADADAMLVLAERLGTAGRRTLLVTAPDVEGLALPAATALADAYARAGGRAALIDCDLHAATGSGLESALAGASPAAEASSPTRLGAERAAGDPLATLASRAMRDLVTRLGGTHDVVVLAAPGAEGVAGLLALAPLADAAVLVVAAGQSHLRAIDPSSGALAASGVPVDAVLIKGGSRWTWRNARTEETS